MDDRRFDGLLRAMADPLPRRGVLAVVVGGSVLPIARRDAADGGWPKARKAHPRCATNAECRGRRDDPCTRAKCRRGRWAFAAVRCAAGRRCCGNGRCCEGPAVPACADDADCAANDPCQRPCRTNGRCLTLVVDCAPGFVCCADARCCPAP